MTSNYLTFDYFSKTLLDPFFEVLRVLDNKKHPEYKKLKMDLYSIDETDLKKYVKKYNIDFYVEGFKDKDIRRRAYYFIGQINKDIARIRIDKLLDSSEKPAPYSFNNLKDLVIDKNNLASIRHFNIDNFGFEKDGLVYILCPILEQSNSSYWICKTILDLAIKKNLDFKIRLDPFIEIPINNYYPILHKMYVYGRHLDWKRLLNLRNDDFGKWLDVKEYNRAGTTDYIWSAKDESIHFTCEELPKTNLEVMKISRYFHSILDKKSGEIIHCDGAIRVYSKHELKSRTKFHVKDPEVRKIGKRIKIFQYEGKENQGKGLEKDEFCLLATNFFVWNDDVLRYFN